MHSLTVFGITGRMGQSLLRALREPPAAGHAQAMRLSGAVGSAGSRRLGQDAASVGEPTGVSIVADSAAALRGATVALDFSAPQCAAAHAMACATAGVPVLIGTTGLDAAGRAALEQAALHVPVLIAANTSVAVSLMATLVSMAAAGLGVAYDVEIFEAHHRMKRDAPSGTALALGLAVAQARAQVLNEVAVYGWTDRELPRAPGAIGFSVLRAGDIVGEHRVIFAGAGERIEITHQATDRMIFARGALRAAEWLVRQPAGLYGMQNVLGL